MPSSRNTQTLAVYTAAVFVSALLLFGVQPMFARLVLPILGGSPSVWSVAMVFFQSMLLAGYVYAHWLAKAKPVVSVTVHLIVLAAAGLTLPLTIATGWGEPPSSGTELWLLALFAVSIGPPFLALSANNPLLQSWFVRTGHPAGKDPYFLYAASNVGSFLALISYPVLLEPLFTLRSQNLIWSGGFWFLIVLIAGCAVLMLRSPAQTEATSEATTEPAPAWSMIGKWMFLSAIPSGLLVAVTAHISTDVAAAPFLWIIPLSLYLLTWVLVFQTRPLLPHRLMLWLQPVAIVGIVAILAFGSPFQLALTLGGHLAGFFIIAMASHGELARQRPAAAYLTTFYVSLSAGGMIGGLFAGLIAPYLFSWIAEYPILLALAAICRPTDGPKPNIVDRVFWAAALVLVIALLIPPYVYNFVPSYDHTTYINTAIITVAVGGGLLMLISEPLKAAFAVAIALSLLWLYPVEQQKLETVRSFFGVHKIYDTPDGYYRVLMHGTTIHGGQRLLNSDGTKVTGLPETITYYHEKSPMAQVVRALRASAGHPLKVAVVGLGSGTLACLSAPGETWRFFEIDASVVEIARDKPRFTFMKSCAPDAAIIVGDARLTMTREPDKAFDLIIIDAYSSDAIPIHLATREAMAVYKSKLTDKGVVMMHVSNRHLELGSVVAGIAGANGLKTWTYDDDGAENEDAYVYSSEVVIGTANPEAIAGLTADKNWKPLEPDPNQRVWTDDYSNVLGALMRKVDWSDLPVLRWFKPSEKEEKEE